MRIGHVVKPGHKCINPFKSAGPASYIKAGERLQYGTFELFYLTSPSNPKLDAYEVYDGRERNVPARKRTFYEFNNYNCALAKLKELGDAQSA